MEVTDFSFDYGACRGRKYNHTSACWMSICDVSVPVNHMRGSIMLQPIEEFCKNQIENDPSIMPAEMLHKLHAEGHDCKESVLSVKEFFEDLSVEDICLIIVNEYKKPIIERNELKCLLLLCGYEENAVTREISIHYPKSLGYVLMLDDSASMRSASFMIKIDAKAFIDCSRTEDEFGINRFEETADWIYPSGSDPSPAVVTEGRGELTAAKSAINSLKTNGNWTNIGAAVSLANDMVEKMTVANKAYVLVSDGMHNQGTSPATILKNEPPIYIAGLGSQMRKSNFESMLSKNSKSKFYNSPNAYGMMMVFNQILADSSQSLLVLNNRESCQGIDYSIQEFNISGQENSSLVNIVWSDNRCHYTPDYPRNSEINLILIDPDNHSTSIRPQIVEDGFCIFDLRNVRPGKWKLLSQYVFDSPIWTTVGVIQTGAPVSINVTGKQTVKVGGKPCFTVHVAGTETLCNLKVDAVYSCPAIDFQKKIAAGEKGTEAETDLDDKDICCFPRVQELASLRETETGLFNGSLGPVLNTGIINAYLTITGIYLDGTPFVAKKLHSVFVE